MIRDISQGMNFLHFSQHVHGDLKSANVLVDNKFRAKISDFGKVLFVGSFKQLIDASQHLLILSLPVCLSSLSLPQ